MVSSEGVLLASTHVINQRAYANHCGLPFSAIIDASSGSSSQPPVSPRSPVKCKACGAHLNCYCQVNHEKGIWRCSLCGHVHSASQQLLVGGLSEYPELAHEVVEYVLDRPPGWPTAASPPLLVVLVVDTTCGPQRLASIKPPLKQLVRALPPQAHLALITFDGVVSVYDVLSARPSAYCLPGTINSDLHTLVRVMSGGLTLMGEVARCGDLLTGVLDTLNPYPTSISSRQHLRCLKTAVEAALHLISTVTTTTTTTTTHPPHDGHVRGPGSKHGPPQHKAHVLLVTGEGSGGLIPPGAPGKAQRQEEEPGSSDEDLMAAFLHVGETARHADVVVDVFLGGLNQAPVGLLSTMVHPTGGQLVLHGDQDPALHDDLIAVLSRRYGWRGLLDVRTSPGVKVVQMLGPMTMVSSQVVAAGWSDNVCGVQAYEQGQGFVVVLELERDLAGPVVYLQVVMEWTDERGLRTRRVTTKTVKVTSSVTEFLRGVDVATMSVVMAKKAVLQAHKQGAAQKHEKAEEASFQAGAQLKHLANRFGRLVQSTGGLLGFGAKQVYSWPKEIEGVCAAIYQLHRSPLLGSPWWSPAYHELQFHQFMHASRDMAHLMMVPKLYVLQPATSGAQGGGVPPAPGTAQLNGDVPASENRAGQVPGSPGRAMRSAVVGGGVPRAQAEIQSSPPVDLALWPNQLGVLDHGSEIWVWVGREVLEAAAGPVASASASGVEHLVDQLDRVKLKEHEKNLTEPAVQLALSLAAGRWPMPRIQVVIDGVADKEAVHDLLLRCLPLRGDAPEDQIQQLSFLSLFTSEQYHQLTDHLVTLKLPSEPSLMKWCAANNVQAGPSIVGGLK